MELNDELNPQPLGNDPDAIRMRGLFDSRTVLVEVANRIIARAECRILVVHPVASHVSRE